MVEVHVTNENINKKADIDSKEEELVENKDEELEEAEKSVDKPTDEQTAKSRRELEDYLEKKRLREELDDYKLDDDDDNGDQEKS